MPAKAKLITFDVRADAECPKKRKKTPSGRTYNDHWLFTTFTLYTVCRSLYINEKRPG